MNCLRLIILVDIKVIIRHKHRKMDIRVLENPQTLGKAAAGEGGKLIRQALDSQEEISIVLATGTSQFEMLRHLVKQDVDWSRVHIFHLDEYIGLGEDHPASFRKYIRERFADKVPALKSITYINGDAEDIDNELGRLNKAISRQRVEVAFIGIGENAHIAFNDPPADFAIDSPYIRVKLDDECRHQQLGEGWFHSLAEVPEHAISMSVRQIMRAEHIICSVPEKRKASAVKSSVKGTVNNIYPASILQEHAHCTLFLDKGSAMLLGN